MSAYAAAVVDTTNNALLTTVSIAPNYPVSLAIHPNGKVAYLASSLGFNGIDVFRSSSNTVTATIAAPGNPVPFNVAFAPDGSRAYMAEELGRH